MYTYENIIRCKYNKEIELQEIKCKMKALKSNVMEFEAIAQELAFISCITNGSLPSYEPTRTHTIEYIKKRFPKSMLNEFSCPDSAIKHIKDYFNSTFSSFANSLPSYFEKEVYGLEGIYRRLEKALNNRVDFYTQYRRLSKQCKELYAVLGILSDYEKGDGITDEIKEILLFYECKQQELPLTERGVL